MSNVKRYGFPWLECDATDEAYMQENGMTELKDGGFVLWADYARLKDEVERLEHESAKWRRAEHAVGDKCIEFAKTIQTLKAEVEEHEKRWAESEDLISHYKQQRDEAINDCECSRLKAEVERLRKASDVLAHSVNRFLTEHISDCDWLRDGLASWNAAKEVQS